ncbi:NotI family restriction endonuclease [Parafrigoribacterium humi]|uniref:NotI family restriction endonuclease n=1 Tax=Parafrigoribacterium humi TaxID=3144664 RepID=UPI0032EFACC4
MTEAERLASATHALAAHELGLKVAPQPECPFLSELRPGSLCTKKGGVCSIRQYDGGTPPTIVDSQPTVLCPNRFLEFRNDETLFSYIAREFFGVSEGAKVIKEIPFLQKETLDGEERGAKAGRIDWIVVPTPDSDLTAKDMTWIAIETQGVYFSGDAIWPDIQAYKDHPETLRFPVGRRRPDFRSSGAKRLAPQLDAKAPVMNRWGRKVVVVVDSAFFAEMGNLTQTTDFDNAEIVWVVVSFDENMTLRVNSTYFAELVPSISALQAAKPVNKATFEASLQNAIRDTRSKKVFDA